MAGAQRGSPSPSPTPSPNALCSGRWRLGANKGTPFAHSPPAHHNNDGKKAWGRKPPGRKTRLITYPRTRPPYARQKISAEKTRPCPTTGKNEGSAKSTATYKELSSSPFPGSFQMSTGRFSRLGTSGETTFQKTSPCPFCHHATGRPAAKAARRITWPCPETIRAVFGGWGSLRGKGPFFRQKKGPSPSNPSCLSPSSPQ